MNMEGIRSQGKGKAHKRMRDLHQMEIQNHQQMFIVRSIKVMGKAGYPTKSITSQLPSQTEKKGLKKELRK